MESDEAAARPASAQPVTPVAFALKAMAARNRIKPKSLFLGIMGWYFGMVKCNSTKRDANA